MGRRFFRRGEDDRRTVNVIGAQHSDGALADRVIVMRKGEIYLEGEPKNVFCEIEKLWKAGLEVPQSVELIYKLNKELNLEIPLGVYDFDTCAQLIKEKLTDLGGKNVGN